VTVSVDLLSNIVWHSLIGHQARLSEGTPNVRRYARGYTPLVGFADTLRPDLEALATCCDPGEHLYCGGWNGPAPSGWTIEADSAAHQMTFDGPAPPQDDALDARRLDARDAPDMLALARLARPGPFGERTVEMGEYWGVYDAGRLIAMAGERMHAGALREVSGVCTHPDFQGRGLARRLVERLLRRSIARDERPFLHVMVDNDGARRLYERMGFEHRGEIPVRVLSLQR
jgi:ribosomal protein S18 acetylase RimI-like enzyme